MYSSRLTSPPRTGSTYRQDAASLKTPSKNPRFEHVRSTLDTGSHTGNVKLKSDHSSELFKRISRKHLFELLIHSESRDESIYEVDGDGRQGIVTIHEADELGELSAIANSPSHRLHQSSMSSLSPSSASTSLSSPSSKPRSNVFRHHHPLPELHHTITHHQPASSGPKSPFMATQSSNGPNYMLLDLRSQDEFDVCHIRSANMYPAFNIKRDLISPQLYAYKTDPSKILIVYDDDESKVGVEVATMFAEKGFTTVHLLSGGMKHFASKYGEWMEGEKSLEYVRRAVADDTASTIGSSSVRSIHSSRSVGSRMSVVSRHSINKFK